jgi:hypothetical protein
MIIESRNASDTGAGGQFINPLGGLATAPYYAYLGSQVEWDSFVDIGLASWGDPNGPASQLVDGTGLSPGFGGLPNSGSINTDNAGWFVTGPQPQGQAGNSPQFGQNWGVLIMQLTVNAGNNVRGTVNVGGINNTPLAGGTTFAATQQTFNSFDVPAPGVLALVGLAGLVGTRRRR